MTISVSDLQPCKTSPPDSRWRRIITPIPVPESIPVIQRLRNVEAYSNSGMPPILWHEAEGFLIRDPYGNQWIDLTSVIVMANIGHGHPCVRAALHQAADAKLLATYAFPTEARLQLLEKLVAVSPIPDSKAILFSAGTEATEAAIMLMRRQGQKIHPEKVGILSFADGYHGRTLAAGLASGLAGPNDWIPRKSVRHYQIPFPFGPTCNYGNGPGHNCDEQCFHQSLAVLETHQIDPDLIAGFIGEPMPGWATWPMTPSYAAAMKSWAQQHNILICFDEVQSGCGRSGKFFATEHVGVVPDLITLGKGLTSSVPVSAVIGRKQILDEPTPGEMSSTHGGNPVGAQVALASLKVLEEEELVLASAQTGELLLAELQKLAVHFPERILSVHGRGLFISVHLRKPGGCEPDIDLANLIVAESVRRGVLMFGTGRGFLKIAPPLCIDLAAALEAAQVINDCFHHCVEEGS